MLPDKKICVVGAGNWGRNHIRTLHALDRLGGIIEPKKELHKEVKEQYPQTEIYESLSAAMGGGFDGFIIATPAETHFEIGIKLIENNFPLLIEKPLTLTLRDAEKLINKAGEKNVNVMVGHLLLFHPAIKKIKTLIQAGKIGKLQYIYSNRLNLGTIRVHENVFWSFAPHDISILNYFTNSLPEKIDTFGGAFIHPPNHDTTITYLEYPENIKTHIFVSWLHPFKEHRIVLIGSKGMISFEDSSKNKDILFYEKGVDWAGGVPVAKSGPTEKIYYEPKMPLEEEIKYFIENMDKSFTISNGTSGLEVVKILEAASASLNKHNI
ncbi:MAG: Gfo/Idh/MocA family oxidoreductase [Candidatus Marinimicrobia bacterium]|nr:Gfo/Idh/MocA family oxidoreductase [Candidatus Neomarinimicrobiota bacterium]